MQCEGCRETEGGCQFHTLGSTAIHGCPCKECLVKPMCDQPCEIFATHVNDVYAWTQKPKTKG